MIRINHGSDNSPTGNGRIQDPKERDYQWSVTQEAVAQLVALHARVTQEAIAQLIALQAGFYL